MLRSPAWAYNGHPLSFPARQSTQPPAPRSRWTNGDAADLTALRSVPCVRPDHHAYPSTRGLDRLAPAPSVRLRVRFRLPKAARSANAARHAAVGSPDILASLRSRPARALARPRRHRAAASSVLWSADRAQMLPHGLVPTATSSPESLPDLQAQRHSGGLIEKNPETLIAAGDGSDQRKFRTLSRW